MTVLIFCCQHGKGEMSKLCNILYFILKYLCYCCTKGNFEILIGVDFTAVKSNALAELMNRASKIHWKNLSLTLNGRNSETKNDKNNPKVPFFQYVQLLRNISFLLK